MTKRLAVVVIRSEGQQTERRTKGSAGAAPPRPGTLKDAVYLNARGVSFAILTTGRWDEVASYVDFMGYTQPLVLGTRRGLAGR